MIKFFEGGFDWNTLTNMPIDELFAVISEANAISKAQQAEIERAKRGK